MKKNNSLAGLSNRSKLRRPNPCFVVASQWQKRMYFTMISSFQIFYGYKINFNNPINSHTRCDEQKTHLCTSYSDRAHKIYTPCSTEIWHFEKWNNFCSNQYFEIFFLNIKHINLRYMFFINFLFFIF